MRLVVQVYRNQNGNCLIFSFGVGTRTIQGINNDTNRQIWPYARVSPLALSLRMWFSKETEVPSAAGPPINWIYKGIYCDTEVLIKVYLARKASSFYAERAALQTLEDVSGVPKYIRLVQSRNPKGTAAIRKILGSRWSPFVVCVGTIRHCFCSNRFFPWRTDKGVC